MPATEYQGSFLGRISIRRSQVVSMDGHHEQELEDLDLFQRNIADRFSELLPSPPPPPPPPDGGDGDSSASASADVTFLSVAWLRKLLDVFLCCEAEFKAFLIMGRERDPSVITKPPLDRLLPELLDRAVKALDVCNAVMNGVDAVRHCQKLSEIAVAALEQQPIGEGQARRAKKALGSMMAVLAAEDKESSSHRSTERTWSFGRRGGSAGTNKDRSAAAQFRTLSWGVSKNWSASKQIQAMSANLVVPRGAEASGLALPVYIMGAITVFVMSALVAAIPCQERSGLAMHLQVPKQFAWAQSMTALQEKIGEEWKRKEKRGTAGLMEEVQRMERLGQALAEFADSFQFPSEGERTEEAAARAAELAETCRRMEEGLVPLQMQIREVFHRIVRSRSEVLDVLVQAGKLSAPTM
ncbi:protein ROH1 [Syzygium oleosum]|uniref:protein ROH1 n=1 Tax=Syzygium oleosum TaxID=219896 RepID=UPI0024BA4025|nr:protein ROH1 [Syzygium oleosum]